MNEQEPHFFMDETMNIDRKEAAMSSIEVIKLADGLGFGAGKISYGDRDDITPELLTAAEAVIQSDQILVDVDTIDGVMIDDDGCGDGREVGMVFVGDETRERSLNRPKVFGGGATMCLASRIGLGLAKDESLTEAFGKSMDLMDDRGLDFGAHSGHHQGEGKCDCGAIDRALEIIANAGIYREQITGIIGDVLGLDTTGLDDVFDAYATFAERNKDEAYAGENVLNTIRRRGHVVKELAEEHMEMFVVLNTVEGKTVNQEAVRVATDKKIQVFAVDVWRLIDRAGKMYPEDKGYSDADRHEALLGELVYTLSTAATLTKGDMPVYMVKSAEQLAAA